MCQPKLVLHHGNRKRRHALSHVNTIYGLIIDPHYVQLLVGLITQLVENCTGIAAVTVRVPLK